jgi:hypothetical protein
MLNDIIEFFSDTKNIDWWMLLIMALYLSVFTHKVKSIFKEMKEGE